MSFSAQLPDGWALRPLEELTMLLRRGKSPVYAETETQFPIVNQKCIEWGNINRAHLKYHAPDGLPPDEFFLQDQDILLNSTGTGTIGRIAQFRQIDGVAHMADSHVTIARINPAEANPKLVAELLSSEPGQRYLEAFCFTGSTNQLELSRRYLARLKVPLSGDIDEQARIANTLEEVDACIAATQASIAAAQRLKQALMQNLLTGRLKPDGTWRREDEFYIDPKFGRVPTGWCYKRIREITESYAGATPSRSDDTHFQGDISWVKSSELKGRFIDDAEEKISEAGFAASSTKWIPPNTVLFAMYGATAGDVAILRIKACANQAVLALPPKDTTVLNYLFLYYALKWSVPNLIRITQGGGQPNLSKTIIDKSYLCLPDAIEEQMDIAARLDATDDVIESRERKLDRLRVLKEALMQNLLTGKIRIPAE